MYQNSSTYHVNVVWVELDHSLSTLGKNNVSGVVVIQETCSKNELQRKLLFSNQFSDYSATIKPILFLDVFYNKIQLKRLQQLLISWLSKLTIANYVYGVLFKFFCMITIS